MPELPRYPEASLDPSIDHSAEQRTVQSLPGLATTADIQCSMALLNG